MATLDQSFTTNNGHQGLAYDATTLYISQGFTVSATGEVDSVDVYLIRIGTGGADYSIEIWSDDGSGAPSAKISDTQTINASGIATSLEWKTYTFATKPALTSGDKAHIVIYGANHGTTNYLRWGSNSTGGYAGGITNKSGDGSSWSAVGSIDTNFREYYNTTGWGGGTVSGVASSSIASMDTVALGSIASIDTVT